VATLFWQWLTQFRQVIAQSNRARRSLKVRLVLWNTVVVAFIALAILLIARNGTSLLLDRSLLRLLEEDANEIVLGLQSEASWSEAQNGVELQRKADVHRQEQWFVELLDREGHRHWATDSAPLTRSPLSSAFREVEKPLRQPVGAIERVRVGASYAPVREQQRQLDRWAWAVSLLAIVAAPAGGYWLAQKATAPFAQTIATARRLRPGRLDERLPVRGTGDELDRLSLTINGLLDRLAIDVRRQQDSLANSAHELRSPLAAIRATAEVAMTAPRTTEDYASALEDIVGQCDRLQSLVSQLLLLAETESDLTNVHRADIDLQPLTQSILEMMEPLAESRSIDLRSHWESAFVQGTPGHLQALLVNLLDNALKFTPPRGRIEVRLRADHQQQLAVWEVSDSGPGIASGDLPNVTKRFYRGKATPGGSSIPGNGLGLAICQSIAESHGGTLTIESELGRGTRVQVQLPLIDH
jgi:signal transduction histidine kinase